MQFVCQLILLERLILEAVPEDPLWSNWSFHTNVGTFYSRSWWHWSWDILNQKVNAESSSSCLVSLFLSIELFWWFQRWQRTTEKLLVPKRVQFGGNIALILEYLCSMLVGSPIWDQDLIDNSNRFSRQPWCWKEEDDASFRESFRLKYFQVRISYQSGSIIITIHLISLISFRDIQFST